ncbi:hypothetical protein [Pontibacillus salipaludis]|uniref:Uncharacterized protein n=1 Tax=Pontibacillus salipaludis TaxID=1697394 RepID=A0ABQ1PVY9_9BACI|nr:hypothetical protein [Pontibacillus salipaludis]GGD05472.1 hypothetical protein GCM10011389_11230 [Pontibacillus salipaludis]
MNIGDTWFDIDGNEYEVIDVNIVEREDGSTVRNVISKRIN